MVLEASPPIEASARFSQMQQSGSTTPNLSTVSRQSRTDHAGRTAAVGYSAVVMGTTRGAGSGIEQIRQRILHPGQRRNVKQQIVLLAAQMVEQNA